MNVAATHKREETNRIIHRKNDVEAGHDFIIPFSIGHNLHYSEFGSAGSTLIG